MRQIIKKILSSFSANQAMQIILEKNVRASHYLMGINAGGETETSGELGIFKFLRRNFKQPYCIFDVGANKGQFLSLCCECLAGCDYRIHCFEPGRQTYSFLESARKSDQRIILNNVALGSRQEKAVLHYDEPGSGLASLTKRNLFHFDVDFDKSEAVDVSTIDYYCDQHSIDFISLLKMDIEGHELDALAGALQMFDDNRVDAVAFEFGGCNIDTRTFFRDFWLFFTQRKFKLMRISPAGYLIGIDTYGEALEQFGTSNFLAVSTTSTRCMK